MRLRRLRDSMQKNNIDAALITREPNILYFTGFRGGTYLLVPLDEEPTLYVYGVDYEAAREELSGIDVKLLRYEDDPNKIISEKVVELGCRSVGFDFLDAKTYEKLGKLLGTAAELREVDEVVWSLRTVKDEEELKLMAEAARLTELGLEAALEALRPGVREYEVAAEAEYAMRRNGAEGPAFETIVASGPRSAYPHGWSSDRTIREGDLVIIDLGAKHAGYCSDLTRTYVVGKPTEKQLRLYEAVREAQEKALKAVRAGVEAREVDAEARKTLETHGLSKYFVHGLGHGVGLEIHEPPRLNQASKAKLKAGNVITIEPGVYIPGYGGIRIEDTVLVVEEGAERLTKAGYGLSVA